MSSGKPQKFSWAARAKSFIDAFNGFKVFLKDTHNAWIHTFFTVLAIALGFVFCITAMEWCAVVITCAIVWSAEAFNTSIECLCDHISPDHNEKIGQVKDIAASAVLITAIGAAFVGAIVFGPYFLALAINE